MSNVDLWADSEGPETERIQPLPDTSHRLPSVTPEQEEVMARNFFEKLDATLAQRGVPKGAAASAAFTVAAVWPRSALFPLARAEGERQAVEESATVRSPTFDERALAAPPAEPIMAAPPAEPIVAAPPAEAREARPAKGGAIEDLKITMPEPPIPAELREQLGRLPFKPRAPGTELARTLQVPVLNPRQGQTTPFGDDSIQKTVAALPFAENTVGAGVVPLPRLSIEQVASLRAELAVWPEWSDEIQRRYYVMNDATRRALEEHWQAELAASPEARARFDKLLAEYTAYLRTQRG